MKQVVRGFIEKIQSIRNKVKYNKIKRNINNTNDTVYLDLGASNIKMSYRGELITFRSSIRKVLVEDEITIQKNAIRCNGYWYIVGESNQPTGNYEYKYQKEYLEVLILFGLSMLKDKVNGIGENLKVNALIPFNELSTKKKLADKINGVYEVNYINTLGMQGFNTSITLGNIFVEGEASKVYIEKSLNTKGNLCVVNIGYSTTEAILVNTLGNRENFISINIGTNNLMSQYLKYTKAPTSSILSSWLNDGYTFSKDEARAIAEVNKQYISMLWNDIYNGVIKLSNPINTSIVFVGGGANLLSDSFKDAIPKEYNVKVLIPLENSYSDLLGMILLSNDTIEPNKINPVEEVPATKKISNYERFRELKEKGLEVKEIATVTGLAIQTLRNYNVKYNKELQVG